MHTWHASCMKCCKPNMRHTWHAAQLKCCLTDCLLMHTWNYEYLTLHFLTWFIPNMLHTWHYTYLTLCISDMLRTLHDAHLKFCITEILYTGIPDMIHKWNSVFLLCCILDMLHNPYLILFRLCYFRHAVELWVKFKWVNHWGRTKYRCWSTRVK